MWCGVIELLVIMFGYQKWLKEYSTLNIDDVDQISFEELVWKVDHSLFVFKTIHLPQHHSIIPSKGMNLFSNQINQILIFHNYLLMNFLLMLCIILFYYFLSIIHKERELKGYFYIEYLSILEGICFDSFLLFDACSYCIYSSILHVYRDW